VCASPSNQVPSLARPPTLTPSMGCMRCGAASSGRSGDRHRSTLGSMRRCSRCSEIHTPHRWKFCGQAQGDARFPTHYADIANTDNLRIPTTNAMYKHKGVKIMKKHSTTKSKIYLLLFLLIVFYSPILIYKKNEKKHIDEPSFSDFVPYNCNVETKFSSCKNPIKVYVSCINIDDIKSVRPFTAQEKNNHNKACRLLPYWIESDPRLELAEKNSSQLDLTFNIIPYSNHFVAASVQVNKKVIRAINTEEEKSQKASFFVQDILTRLEERGLIK